MSKLEELIEKLCPNGVEYKCLNVICNYERGKGFKKDDKGQGNSPIIFYGELYTTYGNYINEIVSVVDETKVAKKVIINKNDIVLPISSTTTEAQIGKVSVVNVDNVILGSDAIVIHHNLNPGYLMYYLNSKSFEYEKMKCVSGTTIRHLSPSDFMKIKIPVPPIEVQNEIVRILDNFTGLTKQLTTELTAELKMRQEQYEDYRDKLFEFDNKVEFYKLKDVCYSIKDGMHNLPKENSIDGEYPILSAQNINNDIINFNAKRYVNKEIFEKENKRINLEKNDVLLTIVATIGRTAVVEQSNMLLQRSVCALKCNEKILPLYLKYYLDTTRIQNYMRVNAHGSAQAGLYLNQVAEIKVPVPTLEKQLNIIEVLKHFNKLYNAISQNLQSEIDARQKQYEYYRNKLLNFKEL